MDVVGSGAVDAHQASNYRPGALADCMQRCCCKVSRVVHSGAFITSASGAVIGVYYAQQAVSQSLADRQMEFIVGSSLIVCGVVAMTYILLYTAV
ncbi:MAG: hypothetical protein S4CHLAM27_03810 [Chlamydiia bacterium]|nr:hypothetical protein [Chlamydiia bacterium]